MPLLLLLLLTMLLFVISNIIIIIIIIIVIINYIWQNSGMKPTTKYQLELINTTILLAYLLFSFYHHFY